MEGKKQAQVTVQLATLEEKLECLDACIGEFGNRLSSVLRGEVDAKKEERPQQELVSLANRIRISARRVDDLIEALRGIMARLEL